MTARRALRPAQAHAVWNLLVKMAGANEGDRDAFVDYLTRDTTFGHEYRFMGLLGFGGKLHYDDWSGAQIGCYPEDRDDVRDAIVTVVNEQLATMIPSRESHLKAGERP
jgi:hypothetical protein